MNTSLHRNSLARQLTRRVTLLSLIAISSLLLSIIVGLFGALLLSQRELNQAGANAARSFDLFLSSLESDLAATADSLPISTSANDVLRAALERGPAIFQLSVIDADGAILFQRRRVGTATTTQVKDQPWLASTHANKVFISSVSSEEFGVPFIDMALPIHESDGHITNTLVAKIDLTALWSKVTAIRIGASGYAYVADTNGRLLAYRDLNLVQNGNKMVELGGQTPQQVANGGLINLYAGVIGQPVVGVSVPLSLVPWYTLVEQPLVEALQGFSVVVVLLLIAFAVVVWLVYSIGRFTRRRIVSPILVLRDNADAIRGGDLKRRIKLPDEEGNEIGMLAGAFNEMVERVEGRTQELIVANALAKESARLKSEFMATMSHELRTPLNAMLGFSGILLEGMGGEIDDEARHMIERIDSNSRRLLSLINDVLDIARIEAGRLEIVSVPISPRTLADQWKLQMAVLAEQKHLKFEVVIHPDLPPQVYGDGERISQIAVNLLSNAFKFTEQGCVKLMLKPEGDNWLIEVTDTGIGIPPHALNYIFDEFRQLDGTSRRAYGGSGLGLAIVRNLCRMMNGNVRVVSGVNQGSTFTVTMPLIPVLELA